MSQPILMITALAGAENCATVMSRQLGSAVELVASRKAALAALRRTQYAVVVVDDSLAEADPEGTELIWKHAELAVPLQVNFAISGTPRIVREVRSALVRREQCGRGPLHGAADLVRHGDQQKADLFEVGVELRAHLRPLASRRAARRCLAAA